MTKKKKAEMDVSDFPPCEADDELKYLLLARYNLIYVVTWEEQRVMDSLCRISEKYDLGQVISWDAGSGSFMNEKDQPVSPEANMGTLEDVLDVIKLKAEECRGVQEQRGPIYLLKDAFRFLENRNLEPVVERKIRSLSSALKSTSIHVVMTSPVLELPTALQKCVTVLDYPLPGREQLEVLLENTVSAISQFGHISREQLANPSAEKVVDSLLGLTFQEAEDALAKSIAKTDRFDISILNEIKREIIRKGQILEFVSDKESMSSVGGFQGLKEFVRIRKAAFSEEAREYGLPSPKGIFLLGVQGSGKSLSAQAVASELVVPLLKMDVGRVFGSYIGESEGKLRSALALAESVAPCVLLVDEVDKALSGGTGGQQGDSGTTKRVIGHFLNWMQSRKAPVFVVACANSIRGLPPEILRKGRFDELFFVDLPRESERAEIFEIHISKRGRDPNNFDVRKLAGRTENFSGAEIEGVIEEAMYLAFDDEKREFNTDDILVAVDNCKPLAKIEVMRNVIDELREESRGRMRQVNSSLYADGDKAVDVSQNRFMNIKSTTGESKDGQ